MKLLETKEMLSDQAIYAIYNENKEKAKEKCLECTNFIEGLEKYQNDFNEIIYLARKNSSKTKKTLDRVKKKFYEDPIIKKYDLNLCDAILHLEMIYQ